MNIQKKDLNITRYIFWIDANINIHATRLIDFYNKYHFDYRGLIDKGLAIEVTEENNPYNKK